MFSKMERTWSREQVASGLRLAGSGVPVIDIAQMMGVSSEVFYAWKAEYTELFDKLITRLPEPKQPIVKKYLKIGFGGPAVLKWASQWKAPLYW